MAHTMSAGDCDNTVEHKDESTHKNLVNISNMHELETMSNDLERHGNGMGSSRIQKLKRWSNKFTNLSTSCKGSPDLEFSATAAKHKSEAYQLNQFQ